MAVPAGVDCVTGRFEDGCPVRAFRWSRGERRFPGWYWATTTGRHEQARWWERHILEVLHGLLPDAPEGAKPRPEFDPEQHSLAQRERAKAA